MSRIRVVWGSATGPTAMAAYDAALAAANVHNYNLVAVSSVVPADPPVDPVGTAPDLGPAGQELTVVESRATVAPGDPGPACAGIGWTRSESGRGLFYESSGTDPDEVHTAVHDGLAAGQRLREWAFDDAGPELIVECADADPDAYTTAVVLAVYGESRPIV
ncbi:MAG: pyruvoyl-dependent arginine decarboxylase [Haloarculaceae archaeon]